MLLNACIVTNGAKETRIFEDQFDRAETPSGETLLGKGWHINKSPHNPVGRKASFVDGYLRLETLDPDQHRISAQQRTSFRDGRLSLDFRLLGQTLFIHLDFASPGHPDVHHGHLFSVQIRENGTGQIIDLKSGKWNSQRKARRDAGLETEADRNAVRRSKHAFTHTLDTRDWVSLNVQIVGDTLTIFADGTEVTRFKSPGFAHDEKQMIRIATPGKMDIDNVEIIRLETTPE